MMKEQLIELQMQLSFQEQTINELNSALISQQQQIDGLVRELKLVREHLDDALKDDGAADVAQDETPPHY